MALPCKGPEAGRSQVHGDKLERQQAWKGCCSQGWSSLLHLSVSRSVVGGHEGGAGPHSGKTGTGDLECGRWQVKVAVPDWETVL